VIFEKEYSYLECLTMYDASGSKIFCIGEKESSYSIVTSFQMLPGERIVGLIYSDD